MRERPLFFDMKPHPAMASVPPLAVSKDVLDMTEAALERAEDERKRMAIADAMVAEIRSRISPPGTLGLPPLLDARREEYGLTDAVFQQQAMWDKVFLMQIDHGNGSETYDPKGVIVMPETGKKRKTEAAPRGIIVSAGLLALDQLESNGSGLGHIVLFTRLTPWRVPFEMINGHERYLIPLNTCDIVGDEDTWSALRAGTLTRSRTDSGRHSFAGKGEPVEPNPEEIGV